MAAGVWAPLCMLIIVTMLYLFRSVYGEVGSALPLNGGAYNALLNTTSKGTASIAACLTILSYVATCVVSGAEACHYLAEVWKSLDVFAATFILLAAFAFLNLMGLSESANVACAIFFFHGGVLTLLLFYAIVHVGMNGFDLLRENWHSSLQPPVVQSIVRWLSVRYMTCDQDDALLMVLNTVGGSCMASPLPAWVSLVLKPAQTILRSRSRSVTLCNTRVTIAVHGAAAPEETM